MPLADVFKQMMTRGDKIGPDDAQRMAAEGRNGDSIIAHINPREAAILKALGGSGTINPKTGAMEFFDDSEGGDQTSADPTGGFGGADPTGGYADRNFGGYDTSGLGGFGLGSVSSANEIGSAAGAMGSGGGGNGYASPAGFTLEAGPATTTPTRNTSMVGPSAGSFVTPSFGQTAIDTANQFGSIAGTVDQYAGPQGANLGSGLYASSSPGDNLGAAADAVAGQYGSIANTVAQYGGDLGGIAGSGLYGDAATTGDGTNGSSPTAVGGAATPAAGTIAPDATQGWNPLSSWQDSFAPAEQGQEQALGKTDQGEVVYSNDEHAVNNMRGMVDNTNYAVDGFNVPGREEDIGRGLGSMATVDPERPDASTMGAASPRGQGVVSTWSGVGPAGFGIGDPDQYTNAASRQDPNAPNMGSLPTDAYGARVPEITNAYRDQSSFSSPMADAMTRAYDANANLPNGYLEGMYGVESGYGRNMHTPGSSYYGPMQFSAPSMEYAAPQLSPVSKTDLYDPYSNMAALDGEFGAMQQALGRNPTATEAYAMHQQGVTGGARAINDPYASFTDLGTPQRAVTANGLPADANYRDFVDRFGSRFFDQSSNYSPDKSVQGPVGLGSMFR